MSVELRVPAIGESITEVVIAAWLKSPGEAVARDEVVAELETDKATVELSSPVAGTLADTLKPAGATAAVGEVIGRVTEGNVPVAKGMPETVAPPVAAAAAAAFIMPAAQRVLAEHKLPPSEVTPTGPGGRMLKEDVLRRAAAVSAPRGDRTVPLSPIRKRIAERLVAAQQTAALLTTFNEIDMFAVMALRREHQEAFQQRHGVKLGIMSFFVRATIEALREFPQLNAEIRDQEIVYHDDYDIGIAVGGGKGLAVPILRNAERLGFAELERAIADFAVRAQTNKLELAELQGGTFTISNGGVYGSLLSTPIVNPPQSGILGLHAIQDRPVAQDGQIVIRPMMYVALTYDHRLVDGREAVTFLRRVKERLEAPLRLFLDI